MTKLSFVVIRKKMVACVDTLYKEEREKGVISTGYQQINIILS